MKLFGLGRVKEKLSAQRFEYVVTIHNLTPWPDSGNRAVAVGWQRGKKKRGATRSVYPSPQPGKLGNVARFNEKFELSATLYKAPSGSANANKLGPFKKKCLILAVLETDGRTQATAALGRVVIDLAEYAAIEKQETRAFMVSCNKQIHSAVGDPQLLITIRTRWKKSSATVGANGEFDDTTSMSTDTTGSRMTSNLSSFLRFKHTGQGPATINDEQDLRGFDAGLKNSIRNREDNGMGAIQETHEDDEDEVGLRSQNSNGRVPMGIPPRPTRPINGDSFNGNGETSLRARYGAASAAAAAATRAVPQISVTPSSSNGQMHGSPRSTVEDMAGNNGLSVLSTPNNVLRSMGLQHTASINSTSETVNNELLMAAASEMAVHMARPVAGNSKRAERAAHAAARRLVRTMVCLGPQQGPVFGNHVLRLISSHIDCGSTDLATLAFWWTNLAHMRALLHQCTSTATMPQQVSDSIMSQVLHLERAAFDAVVNFLWEGVLLPSVTDAGAGGARSAAATAASKRAQQEAAIKRWLEGLRLASNRLVAVYAVPPNPRVGRTGGVPGHVPQLRQQALLQCLKRVDALLFHHLVCQPGKTPVDLMADYDPEHTVWGATGATPPPLEETSLPFQRGLLTFGSGMSVKMTVTRLQQWATVEGGLADAGTVAGTPPSLFPLLRAAADLLMMPKELLMEQTIRRDVCQALSIRSMLHILQAFAPDEYAPDAISPDILRTLQDEELRWAGGRPALTDLSVPYRPPMEEALLLKTNSGTEPGIEYDADSEDELVGFGAMAAPQNAGGRFRLLHELWYSGAKFRGAMSVASSSRMGSVA